MNSDARPLLLHLAPGDPEPVREQIVRRLRERIVRGELAAGEPLPGHRRLARQHRVAPSTVEAAYERLAADGLVTGAPVGEVRVAEIEAERRRELVERLQLEELVARELGGASWRWLASSNAGRCRLPRSPVRAGRRLPAVCRRGWGPATSTTS